MKVTWLVSKSLALLLATAMQLSAPAWAQQLLQAQVSLIGAWLGTIEGDPQTRSLIITEEGPTSDGALLMAKYGISTLGIGPVVAKMIRSDDQRQIVLTTQASAKIVVTEQPNGNLQGTFTMKSGVVKGIIFVKTTEEALQQLLGQAKPASPAQPVSLIQPPGPNVPANCAAFSGGWGGEWPVAGYASLWVMSVDTNCSAKFIYPAGAQPPKSAEGLKEAVIKGNALETRRPDGGTTSFELNDGAINARYSGPSGSNSTTLRRIDLGPAAQPQITAAQKAAMTSVPPGPEVPAECAGFYGQWAGNWSQGDVRSEVYFRVAEVKLAGDKCVVRYSYSSSKTVVPAIEMAEVQGGVVTFICNRSTNGTCIFKRSGDALWGSYANLSGGSNNGTFKRVQ